MLNLQLRPRTEDASFCFQSYPASRTKIAVRELGASLETSKCFPNIESHLYNVFSLETIHPVFTQHISLNHLAAYLGYFTVRPSIEKPESLIINGRYL